jgi:hypothetical protein
MHAAPRPPPSITGPVITLTALLGIALGCIVVFGLQPGWTSAGSALFLVSAMSLPCAVAEFFLRQFRAGSGFDFTRPRFSGRRLVRKLTALWAILAVLLLCYAVLPLYRAELYQPFHWLLSNFLLAFLLLSAPMWRWSMPSSASPRIRFMRWAKGC